MHPPPPPPRSRRTSLDACSLNPTAAPSRTLRKTSASPPTPTTFTPNFLVQKKSNSSPALRNYNCFVTPLTACSPSVRQNRRRQNSQMTDDEEDSMIYTSWSSSQQHRSSTSILGKLNARATSSKDRLICTTPGQQGAGETETEADEPVRFFCHSIIFIDPQKPIIAKTPPYIAQKTHFQATHSSQHPSTIHHTSPFRILPPPIYRSCHLRYPLQPLPRLSTLR